MTDKQLDVILAARAARIAAWREHNRQVRLAARAEAQAREAAAAFWRRIDSRVSSSAALLPFRGRR